MRKAAGSACLTVWRQQLAAGAPFTPWVKCTNNSSSRLKVYMALDAKKIKSGPRSVTECLLGWLDIGFISPGVLKDTLWQNKAKWSSSLRPKTLTEILWTLSDSRWLWVHEKTQMKNCIVGNVGSSVQSQDVRHQFFLIFWILPNLQHHLYWNAVWLENTLKPHARWLSKLAQTNCYTVNLVPTNLGYWTD